MSQGSAQVPTSGTITATAWAGLVNTALAALLSGNSGATSPANGPNNLPVQFQEWWDQTSALFPKDRIYDNTNWDFRGTLDIAGSNWMPKFGGGLGTIASAATCDVGSQPQAFLTITGTTTITSFGASLTNGESKRCYASGAFTITNSANIVCPGGVNITTVIGDIFEVMSDGGGVAIILWYQRNAGAPGIGKPTGEIFAMYSKTAPAGALLCDASTIGPTGSGASFTGAQYFNLFTKIWNESILSSATVTFTLASPGVVNWTAHGLNVGTGVVFQTTGTLPTGLTAGTTYYVAAGGSFGANAFNVSDTQAHALAGTNQINFTGSQSGTQTASSVDSEILIVGGTRGLTALADWNNGTKRISVPDLRGRTISGTDPSAGRMTSATMTPGGAFFGSVGGSEVVTLSIGQLPVVNLNPSLSINTIPAATFLSAASGLVTTTGTPTIQNSANPSGVGTAWWTNSNTVSSITNIPQSPAYGPTGSVNVAFGSGNSHLNVQPTKLLNWFIAL